MKPEEIRDPDLAVDYIFKYAKEFASAMAKRAYLEEFRKSKKALLMGECTEKAVNAREQYAYAHPEYIALLAGLQAAIELEVTLKWRLEAARLCVEIWRTKSANNRMTDRSTS